MNSAHKQVYSIPVDNASKSHHYMKYCDNMADMGAKKNIHSSNEALVHTLLNMKNETGAESIL